MNLNSEDVEIDYSIYIKMNFKGILKEFKKDLQEVKLKIADLNRRLYFCIK